MNHKEELKQIIEQTHPNLKDWLPNPNGDNTQDEIETAQMCLIDQLINKMLTTKEKQYGMQCLNTTMTTTIYNINDQKITKEIPLIAVISGPNEDNAECQSYLIYAINKQEIIDNNGNIQYIGMWKELRNTVLKMEAIELNDQGQTPHELILITTVIIEAIETQKQTGLKLMYNAELNEAIYELPTAKDMLHTHDKYWKYIYANTKAD